MCLSRSTGNVSQTSCTAIQLSATTGLRGGGFKEQPLVIWGILVSIYIIVVQGEAVRPRGTVIRVIDNEVHYLLATLVLSITIRFGYAARTPSICGPFDSERM